MTEYDIMVIKQGSIALLLPLSGMGRRWLDERLDDEVVRWGHSAPVEVKYLDAIIDGMLDEGITVRPF